MQLAAGNTVHGSTAAAHARSRRAAMSVNTCMDIGTSCSQPHVHTHMQTEMGWPVVGTV